MNDSWLTAAVLKLIQSLVPRPPTNSRDWELSECHGWKEQNWQQWGKMSTSQKMPGSKKLGKKKKNSLLTCGHRQMLPLKPELFMMQLRNSPLDNPWHHYASCLYFLSMSAGEWNPPKPKKVCVCHIIHIKHLILWGNLKLKTNYKKRRHRREKKKRRRRAEERKGARKKEEREGERKDLLHYW